MACNGLGGTRNEYMCFDKRKQSNIEHITFICVFDTHFNNKKLNFRNAIKSQKLDSEKRVN